MEAAVGMGAGILLAATYLMLLLVAFLALLFLAFRCSSVVRTPRRRMLLVVCANTVLIVAFVESAFWILANERLARDEPLRRIYDIAMHGEAEHIEAGVAMNFTQHHYLNYVLDPRKPYLGEFQYNEKYRIRRKEPIRPRDELSHRILVLGGSTTFCEQIADEEDTWPRQLEELIRDHCGADCDVINGGVGGYNLLENMIHYITLLTELDPDVVVLYEGINDVHPLLYPEVRTDYSAYRIPWRPQGSVIPEPHPLLRASSVYDYFFLVARLAPIQTAGIHGFVSLPYPEPELWASRLQQNRPDVYRRHLEDFLRLLLAQGKEVVVVPQYFTARNDRDAIYASGVDEINEVNREVAEALGVAYMDSFLNDGTFDAEDTFDSCHFNPAGSRTVAALLLRFLDELELLPCRPALEPRL